MSLMAAGSMLALALATVTLAQVPEMPSPAKEHALLGQFAGEWDLKAEAASVPGHEGVKAEGEESAKLVGGFWLIGEAKSSMQGVPMTSVLTIGYDPEKKKYVGTFVCSMDSTLWKYVGSFDETGKKLTLETEGPSPVDGKKVKFQETLELKDKDHKTFTSLMQGEDGKWTKIVTMDYRRKK